MRWLSIMFSLAGCYLSHERDARDGTCTTTSAVYSPAFGGLEGGDAICARELPGSHFYRASRDEGKPFEGALRTADLRYPGGYGETERGDCVDCDGWTNPSSGAYMPSLHRPGCQ